MSFDFILLVRQVSSHGNWWSNCFWI